MGTLQVDPGTILHFFIIKTSIRVNKGAGFLDLLLKISFQPSIIVVKHSIIKLGVTDFLDPPQVFTCWESQWLFCFMSTVFILKVYFSLSKYFFLSKKGKCYRIYNVILWHFYELLDNFIWNPNLNLGFKIDEKGW